MLQLWFYCYLGNLIGSIFTAWMIFKSGLISKAPISDFILSSTAAKMTAPAGELFFRGILCNILVCLAVWTVIKSKNEMGKLSLIFWWLFAFIGSEFEHSIANMTLLAMGLMLPHSAQIILVGYVRNLSFVTAGGTGLASVRSLIEYANNNLDDFSDFEVLAGFKNAQCLLFERDIKRWRENFDVLLTVDQKCDIWGECVGLITEHIAELHLDNIENTEVIVVGPPPMMKYSTIEFQKLGVPDDQIWVSYERKMHCGLGKCGHCKIEDSYVCVDGPVYNYADVKEIKD